MKEYTLEEEEAIRAALEPFAPSEAYRTIEDPIREIDIWATQTKNTQKAFGKTVDAQVYESIRAETKREKRVASLLNEAADLTSDDTLRMSLWEKAAIIQRPLKHRHNSRRPIADVSLLGLAWIWQWAGHEVEDTVQTKKFFMACAVPIIDALITEDIVRGFIGRFIESGGDPIQR